MTTHVAFHTHQVEIDDALDFVDTLEFDRGEYVDHLQTANEAVAWLREHHLLHAGPDPALSATVRSGRGASRALGRIRQVRAALREVVEATAERRRPRPEAVETVNGAMRAQQRLVLVAGGDGISLDHQHEGDPIDDALARIAERIAREVSGDHADRIR